MTARAVLSKLDRDAPARARDALLLSSRLSLSANIWDVITDFFQWLLVDMFLDAFSPSSPRFLVALACIAGLALTGVNAYLLFTSPQPLREPPWGFMAIVCGIVYGPMGAMLSGLHLVRERSDAPFAAFAVLANAGAVTAAVLASTAGR